MKFGLVGFGAWGKHHAKAITQAPGGELVAIATSREETSEQARASFPNVKIYSDYRELVSDSNVETVDIVVPNYMHCEIGVAALDAGKNVLLEKPMAISGEECDRLLSARDRNGRLLSIAHDYRTSQQYIHIKELADRGDLGDLNYININLFRNPFRSGSNGWRMSQKQVGSWILEEPVHFFDLVLWYFESHGDPVSVVATSNCSEIGGDLNDNFSCIVKYKNGAFAVISQTLAGFQHHTQVQVVGTLGSARSTWSGSLDRDPRPQVRLDVRTKHLTFERGVTECEPVSLTTDSEGFKLQNQINRIVTDFSQGKEPTPGEEARKRVIICQAAEQSMAQGCEVAIDFG